MTAYWSDIVRDGLQIAKTRSTTGKLTCYEYWGYPENGMATHKLGQWHRVRDTDDELPIKALRGMKTGTETQDFATVREAEDWIVKCNTWGVLRAAPPKPAAKRKRPTSQS